MEITPFPSMNSSRQVLWSEGICHLTFTTVLCTVLCCCVLYFLWFFHKEVVVLLFFLVLLLYIFSIGGPSGTQTTAQEWPQNRKKYIPRKHFT